MSLKNWSSVSTGVQVIGNMKVTSGWKQKPSNCKNILMQLKAVGIINTETTGWIWSLLDSRLYKCCQLDFTLSQVKLYFIAADVLQMHFLLVTWKLFIDLNTKNKPLYNILYNDVNKNYSVMVQKLLKHRRKMWVFFKIKSSMHFTKKPTKVLNKIK